MLPYMRITGTQEYYDILDSEPVVGDERREDPAAGARRHGRGWQQVTDRLGRDKQLKAYQEAIGWKG